MRIVPVHLLLALAFAPSLAGAQATQPTTAELQRQQEIRQLEADAARLPLIQIDGSARLLKFAIDADMIAVSATVAPNGPESRVISAALPGVNRLKWYSPRGLIQVSAEGQDFYFLQQDLTNPERGQVNTTVSAVTGRVIISREEGNDTALSSIQYIQDPPAVVPTPAADSVRLLITRNDTNDKSRDLNIKVSARSFMELRLKYPLEVNGYLRPIIRSFGGEPALFAIPPALAWQVLGMEAAVDPQLRARVDAVVQRLGADEYRQRQAAIEELKQLGQPAVQILSRIDRTRLSLQQSTEIDSFLASKSPSKSVDSKNVTVDQSFLLDVLYTDETPLRAASMKRLRDLTGKSIDLDPSWSADQRSEAVARLRAEFVPTTQP